MLVEAMAGERWHAFVQWTLAQASGLKKPVANAASSVLHRCRTSAPPWRRNVRHQTA